MSERENDAIKQYAVLEEDEGVAQKKTDLAKAATVINVGN